MTGRLQEACFTCSACERATRTMVMVQRSRSLMVTVGGLVMVMVVVVMVSLLRNCDAGG